MKVDNKKYYFVSLPIAFLFWLLLNWMFSAPYLETTPKQICLEELLASTIFLAMLIFAIISVLFLTVWVIPFAKKSENQLVAYVFPELSLVLGLTTAFMLESVTPYMYFIPVWLLGMLIVYKEIYKNNK